NSEPDRTITQVAQDVIDGKYGNGEARKRNVETDGYNYQNVQNEVNRLLGGGSGSSKSISKVAQDVINGHYGNGTARRRNVEAEGYNYNAVQEEVNRLLGGGGSSNESTSDGGSSLHLPASAYTWNIYNKGGPYTTGNEIHKLTPSAYGGLDYEIQGNPAPHVYLIDTGVKGRVAIYAHPSTGATIS
ncbi:hypothetical protein CVR97_28260, partial [Salmonella enterica subsp. enterica serovar Typhimurium]|uniref:hypothetical protein n=1 Tax=Salmonella enterica TaxID=28901 RepID=UPI000CC044AA